MSLYRRPKFLEVIHEIREAMSREADYDMDLFAESVRSSKKTNFVSLYKLNDDSDSEKIRLRKIDKSRELPKFK